MYTILCAFDDRQEALHGVRKLVMGGLPPDDAHVQADLGLTTAMSEADLELTRFRGHLTVTREGVRNAQYQATVSGGVSSTDH